jgi:hypothetical protein
MDLFIVISKDVDCEFSVAVGFAIKRLKLA